MKDMKQNISIADLLGPWEDPHFDSGLLERCRNAWSKPFSDLTNEELATLLRQKIAVTHLLPVAQYRVDLHIDDETEIFDGELKDAIEYARK